MERSEGGRYSVERDEGITLPPAMGLQIQVYQVVKCADPTTLIYICGSDSRDTTDGETARVVSGRVGGVWKRLLPQFGMESRGREFNAGEEVGSCPLNPRFGDDATGFECCRSVV